ncbi:hypothetical protein [Deinococcus sonorensis]|uniref:Lipoprotein n=2 Tax=Deinococcus sonorensis TaxID=309891 RepID=A0AAU7U7F1_9DEIO
MKRLLLALPLLLAACAPAMSTTPTPAPGEVIVEVHSQVPGGSKLEPEHEAGVVGFADLTALLINQFRSPLPGYAAFHFPDEGNEEQGKGIELRSAKGEPVHVHMIWQAAQQEGKNTVQLVWDSRPVGGSLLAVRVTGTASDPSLNVRQVEDRYLNAFLNMEGVRLVASGR